MATIAVFLVLSGGTAVALSGSNTVQSDDLGPGAQVMGPDVAANAVNGSDVVNNSLGIADLAPAARGARVYGRVPASGANISRTKNISSFTRIVDLGISCIGLASSIDPASAVMIVSPDYFGDSTSSNSERASLVEWDSAAPDCDPGELEVRTFSYRGDSFDNNDGTGSGPPAE